MGGSIIHNLVRKKGALLHNTHFNLKYALQFMCVRQKECTLCGFNSSRKWLSRHACINTHSSYN